jgi:hypothetical protein
MSIGPWTHDMDAVSLFWQLLDTLNKEYQFPANHVRWVPCHHGMARPQVADGGDALQFWRATENILNKQSRTVDKRRSSSLVIGRGANNSP